MSNDFYAQRKRMRSAARQTEQQYSQAATAPIQQGFQTLASNISQDFSRGMSKIPRGVEQGMMGRSKMRSGNAVDGLGDFATGVTDVAGGLAGMVLSPATGLFESVAPNLGVTEALMNTSAGQKAMQLAEEYPRTARSIGNLLDVASVTPVAGMGSRTLNAVADNTYTKVGGFYDSPDPLSKGFATMRAALPAAAYAIQQLYDPRTIAERKIMGTGRRRRQEYSQAAAGGAGTFNEARGNMLASAKMDTQMKNRITPDQDTVVGSSAEVIRYTQDWTDMANKPRVKEGLASVTDVPDKVLEGAVNHLYKVHGTSDAPGQTSLQIRKPMSGEGLDKEGGIGSAGASAPTINALKSPETLRLAKGAMPEADSLEFYKKFLTVAKHSSKDNINKAIVLKQLPKGTTAGTLRQDYWKGMVNKNKGKTVTDKQQRALDFFKEAKPITLTDRGDGIYSFQDNLISTAQDLGGVNLWGAVSVKGKDSRVGDDVYTMISDGHDMFGMNPPGGNAHLTATPIRTFKVGQKQEAAEKTKRKKAPPTDLSRIEELTGIARNKRESDTAYQARVMRDYRGEADLSSYMESASNLTRTGMLVAGGMDEDQEQQR